MSINISYGIVNYWRKEFCAGKDRKRGRKIKNIKSLDYIFRIIVLYSTYSIKHAGGKILYAYFREFSKRG